MNACHVTKRHWILIAKYASELGVANQSVVCVIILKAVFTNLVGTLVNCVTIPVSTRMIVVL